MAHVLFFPLTGSSTGLDSVPFSSFSREAGGCGGPSNEECFETLLLIVEFQWFFTLLSVLLQGESNAREGGRDGEEAKQKKKDK
jgi:hypothetical protein